jgi:hypothetical protein
MLWTGDNGTGAPDGTRLWKMHSRVHLTLSQTYYRGIPAPS